MPWKKKGGDDDLRPAVLLVLGLLLIFIDLCPAVLDKLPGRASAAHDLALPDDGFVSSSSQAAFLFFQPVSINQADGALLAAIPGIGPALSRRILELRARKKSFSRLEELLEVKGIGPRKFAELQKYLLL